MVYTYNGTLSSRKKKEILPFATTWMDLEGIVLSEISQTEKDKYCTYIWNLNEKKSLPHRNRE